MISIDASRHSKTLISVLWRLMDRHMLKLILRFVLPRLSRQMNTCTRRLILFFRLFGCVMQHEETSLYVTLQVRLPLRRRVQPVPPADRRGRVQTGHCHCDPAQRHPHAVADAAVHRVDGRRGPLLHHQSRLRLHPGTGRMHVIVVVRRPLGHPDIFRFGQKKDEALMTRPIEILR